MARIKIELPSSFSFSTTIPIRITDLNYGNHVGNDVVLSLLHEARVQFLRKKGYTELDLEGISLIMADVAIEYKAELFYGDEVKVFVAAHDLSRVGFDICYKMTKGAEEKVVAVAKTGMVCFNYTTRKVAALPHSANEKLQTP